ncbi:MAG: hypothetical protein JNN11_04050 [Candidatus Doudnabacteria bacterium]|nr:hypothetical protein [Candidatus Doudnabacteria bacterium]
MTDNRTVVLSKEIEGIIGRLPGNSRSFVVEDPSASALGFSADLIGRGWESVVYDMTPNTSPPRSLMVVETEALKNAVIVFRRHSMNMGQLYILP